jgi:DNA polymerase III epsilon subunit-like protein
MDTSTDLDTTNWVFIGLDGEMSSADLDQGGRLIQVGAAIWSGQSGGSTETFSSLIFLDESMPWSERAAQVHGIPRADLASAPSPIEVDELFYTWLLEHGAQEGARIVVPIGLNVAAFDMPFFRLTLPRSSSLIARRAVDLNAICFSYEGWDPNPRSNATRDFAGWKRSMKLAANSWLAQYGIPVREHDAGYDALQALVSWWWLREQIKTPVVQLAELDARLDLIDPLRALLGDGLLGRLTMVTRDDLLALVQLLPPDVSPRRWFGTKIAALNGTPLDALRAGRVADVLAAMNRPTHQTHFASKTPSCDGRDASPELTKKGAIQ